LGVIQGTFGVIQGTFSVIQGTPLLRSLPPVALILLIPMLSVSSPPLIQGTFGVIQ
jgi:hypothetical protein